MSQLAEAWLIGFDGVMFDSHDFIEVDWYPSELRIGARRRRGEKGGVGDASQPKTLTQGALNFFRDAPSHVNCLNHGKAPKKTGFRELAVAPKAQDANVSRFAAFAR